MGYEIPTTEPTVLRAGDTWRWRREDLSDYPAPAWTLTYCLRSASGGLDLAATADGSAHLVEQHATDTAERTAGAYRWTAFVSDGIDRYQVGSGQIEILPDVAALETHDGRSFARRLLDAVEAALENRASRDQLDTIEITFANRGMKRGGESLLQLRSQLLIEVRRDEGSGGRPGRVLARFGR